MAHTTREAPRWASPQTKTPGAEVCQSEPQAMAPRRFRVTPRSSRSGVCSTPSKPMARRTIDRKSTRLNSSHSQISYAVFCLKKKKKNMTQTQVHVTKNPANDHSHEACQTPNARIVQDTNSYNKQPALGELHRTIKSSLARDH